MARLKSNRLWITFNAFAVVVLVYTLTQGSPNTPNAFDPELECGKWAVRFLLACLTMSPLKTYFNWNPGIKLRKTAGLWSFGFACVHVFFVVRETKLSWFTFPMRPFIALGLLSLAILSLLAITSNRLAMRTLRKNWKRLHRLVYLAGGSMVVHAILATSSSKKMFLRDPEPVHELSVYLALLIVLLIVRIPQVRRLLKKFRLPQRPKPAPVMDMMQIPDHFPAISPPKRNGNGRHPIPNLEELPFSSEWDDEPDALEKLSHF